MEINSKDIQKFKEEIHWLRLAVNKHLNNILDKLENPTEDLLLGSDIEYLYPYIKVANLKLDTKTLEKYIKNPNCNSYNTFVDNYITPIRMRFGQLCCPLYTDVSIGIHNPTSFTSECLEDLYIYLYNKYQEFSQFVNDYLHKVLNDPLLQKSYGIKLNPTTINLDSNDPLKRGVIILFLKSKNLL